MTRGFPNLLWIYFRQRSYRPGCNKYSPSCIWKSVDRHLCRNACLSQSSWQQPSTCAPNVWINIGHFRRILLNFGSSIFSRRDFDLKLGMAVFRCLSMLKIDPSRLFKLLLDPTPPLALPLGWGAGPPTPPKWESTYDEANMELAWCGGRLSAHIEPNEGGNGFKLCGRPWSGAL
jgi:hypothetical protein